MNKETICIGIVAYDGFDGQVAQDYMRLMFHLGRRCPEYDFQLAIKWKSEQFRARNAIVKAAIQFRADYIWMLDDDHILDIDGADSPYDLPVKLVQHLKDNPDIGVVGALYFQRGGDCDPVVMQESEDDDRPYFIKYQELSGRMQKVDITGGGCMMIRAEVFDKIDEPWFKPEHEWGTDVQLCKQVREKGYEVWCDTSLQIGHLQNEKQLITADSVKETNRDREYKPLVRYRKDAQQYLQMDMDEICELSAEYSAQDINDWDGPLTEYYASRGNSQLARQLLFHHSPAMVEEAKFFHSIVRTDQPAYGADYGCGSAPVGFEFALQGHKMDFIDIDGCGAYDFVKWRDKKHSTGCGWELKGPYDYVLMLDSIEHIENWKEVLTNVLAAIKPGGVLITNFFRNMDFENPEHVTMDHDAVRDFLVAHEMDSDGGMFWVKDEEKEEAA